MGYLRKSGGNNGAKSAGAAIYGSKRRPGLTNPVFDSATPPFYLRSEVSEMSAGGTATVRFRTPGLEIAVLVFDFCRWMGTFQAVCYNGREIAEIFS